MNRALAVVSTKGGTLYFGPGHFALSSALVVSGYGITLRGAGMHPPLTSGCGGSALVALTSNSTLVVSAAAPFASSFEASKKRLHQVFLDCTACTLEHMALSHAATGHDEVALQAESEGERRQQCAAQARQAADALRRPTRHADGRARAQPPPVAIIPRITPTSGSAVAVRRSFAVTLRNLWIESVFAIWSRCQRWPIPSPSSTRSSSPPSDHALSALPAASAHPWDSPRPTSTALEWTYCRWPESRRIITPTPTRRAFGSTSAPA